jgi:pescadillo protein
MCLRPSIQIPSDVDVRVMLTFLELYQTLLGFVYFKLYTDAGLVYPPPLDSGKDESGAGVGAFNLRSANPHPTTRGQKSDAPKVSSKEVRQTIRNITAESSSALPVDFDHADSFADRAEEEFVPQPSKSDFDAPSSLPTLLSLSSLPKPSSTNIFTPYTFWLSRESSRSIFEFLVRSFGGRIGWPATSGGGSPFTEDDESITHVIIDRPVPKTPNETAQERERRRRRKYVQPQWVVDCINAGKILLEDLYAQGKTLPPHLSPFGERNGAYDPTVGLANVENTLVDDAEVSEDSQEEEDVEMESELEEGVISMATLAAAANDPEALRTAELAAEAAGVDYGAFEKEVQKTKKQQKQKQGTVVDGAGEEDMNKMLMSKRKRQLYERMKYGERKRATEVRH